MDSSQKHEKSIDTNCNLAQQPSLRKAYKHLDFENYVIENNSIYSILHGWEIFARFSNLCSHFTSSPSSHSKSGTWVIFSPAYSGLTGKKSFRMRLPAIFLDVPPEEELSWPARIFQFSK